MNGYYTGKRMNADRRQLQHNSKYYPVRSTTHPLQDPDTTQVTAPLRFSAEVEQASKFPPRRVERTTRVLSSDRRATRGTDPLIQRVPTMRDYPPRASSQMAPPKIPPSPSSGRNRVPKNKKNTPFQYHILRIALGIWNLFKETPPGPRLACIFLGIGLLLLVSTIANAFIQITAPFLGPIYIILGIIASIIVIYECLSKQ